MPSAEDPSRIPLQRSLVRSASAIALFSLTIFIGSVYFLVLLPLAHELAAAQLSAASEQVAARLRTDIMTGILRPGTFIRLDETAAQLGVSITPVREALRTLRGEGMVQLEPHRGHVVVPLSRGDVEDIFWLQATIARELAATAAERITEDEIDELEHLNEVLAEAIDHHEPDTIASAEFAFHRAFNRSTGRIKLAWFLLHVARYLPCLLYTSPSPRD